jgi:two-component system, LytTR family, response regulator
MQKQLNNATWLQVSEVHGSLLLNTTEIIRLKACSCYTQIYFTNRKPLLIAKVLKQFEEKLSTYGFVRVHRTHLINKYHINTIQANSTIVMSDASTATIARRMRNQVIKQLIQAA